LDTTKISRRQFLKAAGLTGITAMTGGCSDAARTLVPFVADPEDIVPGKSTWYATTCRECPAGCGILAKNRDGRVIKVEGNPLHPVNTGRLCPRGQASIQGIYNPDRYRAPQRRLPRGGFSALSWNEAEKMVLNALGSVSSDGSTGRIVFLTDLTTGSERQIIGRFLAAAGSGEHIMYEPLAYEALRKANSDIFGVNAIPSYRLDRADFLISFGANFLETWISNVQFARQFAAFREPENGRKKPFLYVGSRLSMTGANADHWIGVSPGEEATVAFGLVSALLEKGYAPEMDREDAMKLRAMVREFTPEFVEKRTGVRKGTLNEIAALFMHAKRPLALAEGLGYQDPRAFDTAVAANILSGPTPGKEETIDFSVLSALSDVARASDLKELSKRMRAGDVRALFILRANPVFHLPPSWEFARALKAVPFVVSLSSFPDETGEAAHLVMPVHTFLESWGDHTPWTGIRGLMQPVMGPVFDTRHAGDVLLSLGRALKGRDAFPEEDFFEALRGSFGISPGKASPEAGSESSWQEALQRGGTWKKAQTSPAGATRRVTLTGRPVPSATPGPVKGHGLSFISYPTVQFFDGRMANRPFLQELPDPVTAITWSNWVEIHPETAERLKVKNGDILTLKSESKVIQAPVYVWTGIIPGTLAMPMGIGHTAFGRFAAGCGENALHLSGAALDRAGGIIMPSREVNATKTGNSAVLAHTDGSADQHGRGLARSITWQEYASGAKGPDVVLPLPEGFSGERDFYPSHKHDEYRWCMVIDLDRCIGCGACVVACYAENNVSVVGKDQVRKGREMAWLHIQRYLEREEPFIRFLPMLCQHCDEAPCESVCPVFAPNHSKEGINNQVYNRCIGTRFCSQNCPYKVRRFNWFTWKHDSPLEWQLNPDVTVRTKGVMEKCSFCIQRINEARIEARGEKRLVRDGEVAPACVETCPADALTFGNLKDPGSRVARMARQGRAYQVLGELNTKPGVIYLKKIRRHILHDPVESGA
jgi:anaerobic selenocysteine-containing dehydrogenase/Fe-S-cluster-containing dehydrogenase component